MTYAGARSREQHAVDAASVLLRMPAVVRCTGLGRSTIYRLMANQQFPLPVKLTGRAVGWRKSDLDRWTDSLPPARR